MTFIVIIYFEAPALLSVLNILYIVISFFISSIIFGSLSTKEIFNYNRHDDNVLVVEKVPALEFIKKLIQHTPVKHFKMIRQSY